MTKQNRFYLLIATLTCSTLTGNAMAVDICSLDDYCVSEEDAEIDSCCKEVCDYSYYSAETCMNDCLILSGSINEELSQDYIDNCANPGSDTGGISCKCNPGYYFEEGGSGCTPCPTTYGEYDYDSFQTTSNCPRNDISTCFLVQQTPVKVFEDNTGKFTITISEQCQYE